MSISREETNAIHQELRNLDLNNHRDPTIARVTTIVNQHLGAQTGGAYHVDNPTIPGIKLEFEDGTIVQELERIRKMTPAQFHQFVINKGQQGAGLLGKLKNLIGWGPNMEKRFEKFLNDYDAASRELEKHMKPLEVEEKRIKSMAKRVAKMRGEAMLNAGNPGGVQ